MHSPIVKEIRSQWRSILLLLLIVWFLLSSAYRSALTPSPGITGIDFQIYYEAANRLAQGQSLYVFRPAGDTYVYSPMLALLLQPLARLDYPTALTVWFFIAALCLGGSVMLYALSARLTWRDLVLVGVTLIIGFRFWPSTMNFSLGQVNFPILLLLCGMFLADSMSKPKWVALLVVAAALVKTWMLGLLVYLVLQRRWKDAAGGAILYAVLLAGSFALVGWNEWPTFWKLTAGYADQSIGQIAATQSFAGFAYLHFGLNHHVQPLTVNPWIAHGFVALGFGLMLLGFTEVWRHPARQPSYEAKLQLGLVILSILLLLPMCQNEYFVFCLPLLWTLLAPAPAAVDEEKFSLPILCGSFLIYLLFTRGWPGAHPIAKAYQHGLSSLLVSVNFFGALALWFITLHALRRARRMKPRSVLSPEPVL